MRFEVYQDAKEQYRWRLIASNGRIVAVSGEGFSRESSALNSINSIVDAVPYAEVILVVTVK